MTPNKRGAIIWENRGEKWETMQDLEHIKERTTKNPTKTTDTHNHVVNVSKMKNIEQKIGVLKNALCPK